MILFTKNPILFSLNWKRACFWGILMGLVSLLIVPPLNLYFFEFFIFVPFCYLYHPINQGLSKKLVFFFGFLLGLFFMICNFYWITYTMMQFGNLSFSIAFLIFLVYSSYVALKMALIFFFPYILQRRFHFPPLISLLFFCFVIEASFPEIFPFYIGNPQLYHSYFVQIADIIGVEGISILVLLVSYLIYLYLSTRQKKYLLIMAIVFFTTYSYAFLRNVEIESYTLRHKDVTQITVGVVQPNVPLGGYSGSVMEGIDERLISQTKRLLKINPHLDLIVWPESAIPFSLESSYGKVLENYIQSLKVPIIYNAAWREGNTEFSAAILKKPGDPVVQHYNKNMLLPFGEYLPTDAVFPQWHDSFPEIGNFARGREKVVFHLNDLITVAPQICYEITLSYFTRHFIQMGGNLIVNLTNDAWFGNTRASSLHLWAASFRAIENRVPIIRATNSGISTIIGIHGWSIMKKTRLFTQTQFIQTIPLYRKIKALYSYLGNWPLGLLLSFLFLQSGYRALFRKSSSTKRI